MSVSKIRWGVFAAALAVCLSAQSLYAAQTFVVGPADCKPGPRHFATIQGAVNAVFEMAVPTTILVCPGTYPEQVVVGPSPDYAPIITLKSLYPAQPAVITAPSGGLLPNYFSPTYGWVAAQFLVTDTPGITISYIEVDGTGGGCPEVSGTPALMAGIMFSNVADSSWWNNGGFVTYNYVHDQLYPYVPGCGYSEGIVSENAYISIKNNTVKRVNHTGIVDYVGNNAILKNTLADIGHTGIRITGATSTDVSENVMSHIEEYGVLIEGGSQWVTAMDNIFTQLPVPAAIYLNHSTHNWASFNTISGSWGGVYLDEGSYENQVEYNTITNCVFGCVMDRFSDLNTIGKNDLGPSLHAGIWLHLAEFDLRVDDTDNSFIGSVPVPICRSSVAYYDPNDCSGGGSN